MAKGKKTSTKTKANIIEEKINNNSQWSDIAKKIWVPERTVQNILKNEFAEVCGESKAIANLIDSNNALQSAADSLLAEMIVNKDDKVTPASLVSLRESTFKQNQLLTGGVTDRVETNELDSKQRRLIAERVLKNKN